MRAGYNLTYIYRTATRFAVTHYIYTQDSCLLIPERRAAKMTKNEISAAILTRWIMDNFIFLIRWGLSENRQVQQFLFSSILSAKKTSYLQRWNNKSHISSKPPTFLLTYVIKIAPSELKLDLGWHSKGSSRTVQCLMLTLITEFIYCSGRWNFAAPGGSTNMLIF